jgi:FkbM family methyltransferase
MVLKDVYDKFFNKLDSEDIFFAVIGAMDGVYLDYTFKYAFKNKHWKGLLIEPMKYYFEKLKENYEHRENLIFENVAISDSEGYEYMFRIPSELVESGEVPSWSGAISTFDPEKNVMREEHLISKAVKEPVLCTTFENISNKHSIEKIDILQIDVEGCDSNVFWQIWNLNYRPKLIIIEIVWMQSEEKNKIEKTLKNNSYTLSYVSDDLIATKED